MPPDALQLQLALAFPAFIAGERVEYQPRHRAHWCAGHVVACGWQDGRPYVRVDGEHGRHWYPAAQVRRP